MFLHYILELLFNLYLIYIASSDAVSEGLDGLDRRKDVKHCGAESKNFGPR